MLIFTIKQTNRANVYINYIQNSWIFNQTICVGRVFDVQHKSGIIQVYEEILHNSRQYNRFFPLQFISSACVSQYVER